MSNKIDKFCKKCNKITPHRFVKDRRGGYHACSVCLESNCKRNRLKNWHAYLAQKANSRKRPRSDKITEKDVKRLDKLQNGFCAISGIPYDINHPWIRPSLDRIDNGIGYKKNNIQLVLWIINHSRGKLSIEDYILMCKLVALNKKP